MYFRRFKKKLVRPKLFIYRKTPTVVKCSDLSQHTKHIDPFKLAPQSAFRLGKVSWNEEKRWEVKKEKVPRANWANYRYTSTTFRNGIFWRRDAPQRSLPFSLISLTSFREPTPANKEVPPPLLRRLVFITRLTRMRLRARANQKDPSSFPGNEIKSLDVTHIHV